MLLDHIRNSQEQPHATPVLPAPTTSDWEPLHAQSAHVVSIPLELEQRRVSSVALALILVEQLPHRATPVQVARTWMP